MPMFDFVCQECGNKFDTIVSNADKESVTVKDVRKKLEEWLDMDLVEHKEGIRAMVMDAM